MEEKMKMNADVVEKELRPLPGLLVLVVIIAVLLGSIPVCIAGTGVIVLFSPALGILLCIVGAALLLGSCICFAGLKVVNPNEALVLTLFGKYYGTIRKAGFHFVNPFASAFNPGAEKIVTKDASGNVYARTIGSKKISTKVCTLNNETQKVNDVLGNPIIIGAVVIWKVANPTQAVFAVENYRNYLSIQCDSTIRNIARLYPYDDLQEEDGVEEKTLRGSSQEIAECMKTELQDRVSGAGLEILEVRITHLSYSEEIAAAMLQRQQAVAVIAARQKIVEGAVSMVKMAIDQLDEDGVVVLDDERKASMVSNLLVVLCGNKEAQPVVNSGSIY